MQKIFMQTLLRHTYPLRIKAIIVVIAILFTAMTGSGIYVLASSTTNFQQTINPGTLSVDIVNSTYVPVASPTVAMSPVSVGFSCQTSTGTFGADQQRIYFQNPDAADNGFTVTLAASNPTDVWDSAGTDFDFNDPTTSGCADSADADSVAGQMTVDATTGTLTKASCATCGITNISLGSSTAFNQTTTDSITLATAAAGSDDIGNWYITGISVSQKIPAEQAAASDYDINMVLSITAS